MIPYVPAFSEMFTGAADISIVCLSIIYPLAIIAASESISKYKQIFVHCAGV